MLLSCDARAATPAFHRWDFTCCILLVKQHFLFVAIVIVDAVASSEKATLDIVLLKCCQKLLMFSQRIAPFLFCSSAYKTYKASELLIADAGVPKLSSEQAVTYTEICMCVHTNTYTHAHTTTHKKAFQSLTHPMGLTLCGHWRGR